MKFLLSIFVLLLSCALAAPAQAHVDEGTAITQGDMQPLAAWVSNRMNVDMSLLPEAVASDSKLEHSLRLDDDAEHAGAIGAYIPGRLVLSSAVWDPASLEAQSYLLHELVHHAQFLSGRDYPCHAAKEREAYTLQSAWLVEHGLKPLVTQEWIDKMSSCGDSSEVSG